MPYRRIAYREAVAVAAGGVLVWHVEGLAYGLGEPCWRPEADVYESTTAYTVTVALAGVARDDVDVSVFADRVAVAGVRRPPPGEEDGVYRVARIPTGGFRLVVPFGERVDADLATAVHANGLLRITLPKVRP